MKTQSDLRRSILDHPRHNNIEFFENHPQHGRCYIYYNGLDQQVMSGFTSFIDNFIEPFDRQGISKGVAWRDGRSQQDVLDEWQQKNEVSKQWGSYIHDTLENYWKHGEYIDEHPAIQAFETEIVEHMGLIPVASELLVYDEDLGVGTHIDFVTIRPSTLEIVLWDFKTNKQIKFQGYKGKMMLPPANDLPDGNYYHYSFQVHMAARWLREKYGLPVADDHYILHIQNPNYPEIPWNHPNPWFTYRAWDVNDQIERIYQLYSTQPQQECKPN